MFSKILVKLIDQAILPAITLVAVRIISVVLISQYYGYTFALSASGFSFPDQNEYVQVNSLSILFMVLTLAFGLGFTVFKSYTFHDSHIKPSLTAKLFSLSLGSLIQNSFELYSESAIWVSYIYLLTIVSGIMTIFSLVHGWVFYITMLLAILFTVLVILDVEKEIKIDKLKDPIFDTDDKYLGKDEDED